MAICLKELNESRVWLKIVGKSKLFSRAKAAAVYKENDELCRIINASVKTSKKR
jgi:four helix bundle protein